jgi:uncharacterized membrane protein YciS (DUF1049 family)
MLLGVLAIGLAILGVIIFGNTNDEQPVTNPIVIVQTRQRRAPSCLLIIVFLLGFLLALVLLASQSSAS